MKFKTTLLMVLAAILLASCENEEKQRESIYARQLKAEKELIADYIKRQGINVISEEPEKWGEKDYMTLNGYDNFYFHLEKEGKSVDTVAVVEGDKVVMRYRKYTLDQYSDTINYWSTDDGGYPVEFKYWNTSDEGSCVAWHVAIKLMKYPNAECKIICPSKLGFSNDGNDVTPYGYDITFKIKRF